MNYLIGLILSILSLGAAAGGWSSAGLLENVEIVRSQGFLMTGDLGDAAGCGKDGFLWIASDHPQYELLYSTALAAFMSGKRVHAYAHTCTEIGWHGGSFSTINDLFCYQ